MWEPRHLTILWASTACYRDGVTYVVVVVVVVLLLLLLLLLLVIIIIITATVTADIKSL
jgi:hypothetical protein